MEDEIIKFLRYPYKGVVNYALDLVQLSKKEREAVMLCGVQKMTVEEAAEAARPQVSRNTMQKRWSDARSQLIRAWSGIEWIETLANTVE